MIVFVKELFKIKVTRDTWIAVAAGLLMIGLSLLMLPFSGDSMGDVIISSEAGSEIKNAESLLFAMIIWLLIVIWLLYRRRRSKRNAVENIHSDHGDPDQGREKCV